MPAIRLLASWCHIWRCEVPWHDAQVTLNGARVPVKTFQDYVNLYLGTGTPRVYEKLGERWEICVSLAEQGQFQQVHTSLRLMVLH